MIHQLQQLDLQLTLALNGSDSVFLDRLATTATSTLTWLPLALVFFWLIVRTHHLRDACVVILATSLCVLLADQIASGIFKPWVARFRPSQDPALQHLVDVVDGYRGGRYGFFSSHAANTVALATFSSLLVRSRLFSLCVVLWAIINCWTRVYLGVHYVGDILAGVLCGLIVGTLVYALLCRCLVSERSYSNMSIHTQSGYSYSAIAFFAVVFWTICLYCLFVAFMA